MLTREVINVEDKVSVVVNGSAGGAARAIQTPVS